MNGNGQENQDRKKIATLQGPLPPDAIEGAITDKHQRGRAEEERFGFAATVANATPPADETFRRALRSTIVAEAVQTVERQRRARTTPDRGKKMNTRSWYPALRIAFTLSATAALLAFIFVTPWGQTLAQSALRFFVRTERTAFPLEPSQIVTSVPDPSASTAQLPAPQLAPEDMDALARRLSEEPDPRTVAVFPADYALALAEQTAHPVVPVALGGDPSPAAARAALDAALPKSGRVDVVLVGQDGGEGASTALVALEQALYLVYDSAGNRRVESFGALQRLEYVAGPADETLHPVGTTFNNGVELVAAGILDAPRPGEPLPVALEWRAERPVDEPLIIFAHVFCEGRLLAQRDAVPGNGQFPAPGWEPGEVVRDQFALQLPEDLPAGQCQVQVGIYDANSGQRYRPTDSTGEPSVVIGRFSVYGAGETL